MAAAAAAESRPIFTPPSAFDETKWSSSTTEESQSLGIKLSSCPLCYEPLIRKGPTGLHLQVIYSSTFKGKKCYKSYSSKNIYLDLSVTAGFRQYIEVKPVGTELFTKWWHLCWNHFYFSTPRSPGHSSHSHRCKFLWPRFLPGQQELFQGRRDRGLVYMMRYGLANYTSKVEQSFIIFSAQKP